MPSIPTIKNQLMPNNTGIKKIPSSCCTSSKSKLTHTINYTIKMKKSKSQIDQKFSKKEAQD